MPSACADPAWVGWPMPNSPVDAPNGGLNPASYTDNGDATVTDNVTRLMWQQVVPTTQYKWYDAIDYCQTLILAGHDDWRLPSPTELYSIVDVGHSNPSINSTYFPATPVASTGQYWTSLGLPGVPTTGAAGVARAVGFISGNIGTNMTSSGLSVRCVR